MGIEDYINKFALDKETSKQYSRINRMEDDLGSLGYESEPVEPRESMIMSALNFMNKGTQAVEGVLDSAFIRQDIGDVGLSGAVDRAWEERTNAWDIMNREGVLQDSPVLRGVLGFGAEMLLDPLSWVNPIGSAAAKAGGKALSKTGMATKTALESKLLAQGLDFTTASNKIDDQFRAAAGYSDILDQMRRAKDPLEKQLLGEKAFSFAERVDDLPLDLLNGGTLFKKSGVKFENNVLFLGHFMPETRKYAVEATKESTGPVGEALKTMGAIFKPGKITLGEMEFSDEVIDAFYKTKTFADEKLGELYGKLTSTPIVGDGFKAVGDTVGAVSKGFKKTFMKKAFVGSGIADADTDYKTVAGGIKDNALKKTVATFGDLLGDAEGKAALTKISLIIDNAGQNPLREVVSALDKTEQDDLLKYINSSLNSANNVDEIAELSPNVVVKLRDSSQKFRQGIEDILKVEEDPRVVNGVRTMLNEMDALGKREQSAGILGDLVESYISHIYKNIGKEVGGVSKLGKSDFTKKRTYSTLAEAFEEGGLVGKTSAAQLLYERTIKGEMALARRAYSQRAFVESGLPYEEVKKLYIAAAKNGADSPEYKVLYRNNLPTPTPISPELLEEGRKIVEESDKYKNILGKAQAERNGFNAVKAVPSNVLTEQGTDAFSAMRDFNIKTAQALNEAGLRPKDWAMPDPYLGELGKHVVEIAGEKRVLPIEVGRLLDETMAGRDYVKKAMGNSTFGLASLKLFDAATNFTKKLTTLPFPSYWAQNILGDTMLRFIDGGWSAIEPGQAVRAFNLLTGKSVLKTASGFTIDSKQFAKILSENGLSITPNEIIDIIDSGGDLNPEKLVKAQKSILENAKGLEVGTIFDKAVAKTSNGFEKFFRINHLTHRLEAGDTVREAVRRTNEALINYRDMNQFEKSIAKRLFMFYGWTSRSTKKTIASLLTQPGDLTFQLKAARGVSEFFNKNPETIDEHESRLLRTLAQQEQISFAIGEDSDGKKLSARGFGLPMNTVLQSFSWQKPRGGTFKEIWDSQSDSVTRTIQKQFSMANPALLGPLQLLTNRQFYFDKPMDAEFMRRLPSLEAAAEKLAPYNFAKIPARLVDDVTKEFLKATPDGKGFLVAKPGAFINLINVVPFLSRMKGTLNVAADERIPAAQTWLRNMSGVRVEPQDPETNFLRDYEQSLREKMTEENVQARLRARREGLEEED